MVVRLLLRLVAAFVAFCVGWLTYMVAMTMTVYDGFPSLILQPFVAAFVSALFVFVSLILGLVLKIPFLARWWTSTLWWASLLAVCSLLLLCCGACIGITDTYVNPDTGQQYEWLHPAAVLGGYFFLIFAIANWPIRKKNDPLPMPEGPAAEPAPVPSAPEQR
jgi:hypothetical protein